MTTDLNKANEAIERYNDQYDEMMMKSLTMGSLKRPKATLRNLCGLEANDNNNKKGQ